ncbi:response regulator [Rhizobium sp. FKY42]|uniref:response regulator n=1 Tax=Rhizobium sp. FKY42 TaxID=2562310 RepID=UPI001485AA47|nr:response regulator [Rhizobium sp. FKY42]
MAEGRTVRRHVQDRYRLLIESIIDYAIYMLNEDGHVASWNLGARRLKGYDPDEILDRHFSNFYTPEDRDAGRRQKATRPFFTTKGIGKGTGLGLAMVQALTEQSGGFLRLHSEPGFGTRAEIILPVVVSTAVSVRTEEPLNCMSAPFDKKLTVLAVDDDALVLMNTTMMLEDLGHIVIEAFNGPEALKVLQSRRDIDMVITDQSMPMMTGVELADRVQAAHPGVPVILATGYSELPTGQFPSRPHLNKPFTQNELQTAIANVFSQS